MLINIKVDGKWGYYNTETKGTIPCRFDKSSDFKDGFAIVCVQMNQHTGYGVIDESGKEIIPFKYVDIKRLENGLFELHNSSFSYTRNCCLCNSNGNLVDEKGKVLNVYFQKYDMVCKIDEDLFFVSLDKKNGIVYKNQLIIEYEDNRYVEEARCGLIVFSNGNGTRWLYNLNGDRLLENYDFFHITPNAFVTFYCRKEKNTGYGIADINGNIIVEPKYWKIDYLHDDIFKLTYQKSHKEEPYEVLYNSSKNSFVLETKTNLIEIPTIYDWCGNNHGKYTIIANNFKFGIIDDNNFVVADCIYSEIKECVSDIAIVKKELYWQLLNLTNGNLSAEYTDIRYIKDNFYIIRSNNSYGVIDKDDNLIVPARFNDDIELLDDGTFKVSKGYGLREYNIINKKGRIIIKPQEKSITLPKEIAWVHGFSENYAIVENSDNIKGSIDISGNMIIPFRFKGWLSDFKDGESIVSIVFGSLYGKHYEKTSRIDTAGKFVCQQNSTKIHIDCDCYLVSDFIGDRAIAYDGNLWGFVDTKGKKVSDFIYSEIEYLDKGFYKVKRNERYGIVGHSSKIILPCKYLNVKLSENDCFEAIIYEEKWPNKTLESMTINYDGLIVVNCGDSQITLPQEYDSICAFEGDYAKVISNKKYGLINKKGNCVLQCKYDFLDVVVNHHIHAKLNGKDYILSLDDNDTFEIKNVKSAKYYDDGCIVVSDYNGDIIIDRNGNDVFREYSYSIGAFNGEYASLSKGYSKKYGIINTKGKVVIPPQYNSLEFDKSGCLLVSESPNSWDKKAVHKKVNYNNETVLVNGDGLVKLPEKYSIGRDFHEGLAAVAVAHKEEHPFISLFGEIKVHKWGFINVDATEIIECVYDDVSDFMFGHSVVSKSGRKGIINIAGECVIPIEYYDITILSKDYVKVKKDDLVGLINFKNESIVSINYSDILEPYEGLFPIKQNGLWGFINNREEVVVDAKYKDAHCFHEGLAAVFETNVWKFINAKGDEIIRIPRGFEVGDFHNGVAVVSFSDKDNVFVEHKLLRNGHYLVDGIEINLDVDCIYRVYHFHDGLAKVRVDDSWGFINMKGEIVISGIFENVSDFKDGYSKFLDNKEENVCLDKSGNLVVLGKIETATFSSIYCEAKHFSQGLYLLKRKEDGFVGVVDRYSKTVIPFTMKDIRLISSRNEAPSYIQICDEWEEDEKRHVFYNLSGDRIIPNNGTPIVISQNYEETADAFSSELAAVSKDNLWGFINEKGEEVIPCVFYNVDDFGNEYCIAYDEEYNKSVIDKQGTLLFPFREYESIVSDNEGFEVTHKYFGHSENYETHDDNWESEWVHEKRRLNKDGELQVPLYGELISLPKNYEWCALNFKEGFLSVYSDGKWGVVDTSLNIIIPCLYDEPVEFDNGLTIANKLEETYVFNTIGSIVFNGSFKNVRRYKQERMFVCLTADRSRFDIYRDNGELLFYSNDIKSRIEIPGTDSLSTNFFSPCQIIPMDSYYLKFCIKANYNSRKIEKWGVCDTQGHIVLEARYDDINGLGSGLIAVCKNFVVDRHSYKLWGYVDNHGKIIIDYQYSEAQPFSKGIAIVSKSEKSKGGYTQKKYGIIGSNGKQLTDFIYESAIYTENWVEVSDYRHKNRISLDGGILYEYYDDNSNKWVNGKLRGYDWCNLGSEGFHIVTKGNKQGIVDNRGFETFALSDLEKIMIDFDEDGQLVFKYNNEIKRINENGRIISERNCKGVVLPVGIHWCTKWTDDYLPVMSHGKWGLINSEFRIIIKPEYEKIQYALNGKVLCIKDLEGRKEFFIYDIANNEYKQLNYDACSDFENGFAIVSKTKSGSRKESVFYGLIDNNGCELLPCTYQNMQFKEPLREEHSSYYYHDSYDDYQDYDRETWYAMTDGMYGDMPDGFDGDYSFLGY